PRSPAATAEATSSAAAGGIVAVTTKLFGAEIARRTDRSSASAAPISTTASAFGDEDQSNRSARDLRRLSFRSSSAYRPRYLPPVRCPPERPMITFLALVLAAVYGLCKLDF